MPRRVDASLVRAEAGHEPGFVVGHGQRVHATVDLMGRTYLQIAEDIGSVIQQFHYVIFAKCIFAALLSNFGAKLF